MPFNLNDMFPMSVNTGSLPTGAASAAGFPWVDAILSGVGILGPLFSNDKSAELQNMLFDLAKNGVNVNKLAAPQIGAINKNFTEALTDRMKGIYSQGLGGSGAVEDVPLGFLEQKNYATGQAYNQANVQNENIKNSARSMLSGMNLGSNDVFGQIAGLGGYNLLKKLLG